ncbi:MAG TPA: DUF4294 domain-containing protein, partial [Puia sp.]|nr:DUF4294 domain-containing protein [Puia sp.]
MLRRCKKYFLITIILVLILITGLSSFAQQPSNPNSRYGPNDTLIVPIAVYNGDTLPARTLLMVWIDAPMPKGMRRRMEEWTRLRNAVYVTYPFA